MVFGNKKNNKEEAIKKKKPEKPIPQIRPRTEQEIEKEVEKYQDTEGLSTKKLNFGLWFVEHRQMFIKLLNVFLVFVGVFSWIYTIYGFGHYLIKGMKQDQLLVQQITRNNLISHDYLVQIGAKDIIYSTVYIFASSGNKYDLAAKAQNINERWYAEFDYYFLVENQQVGHGHFFILPEEEKYIMALGQELGSRPSNAKLVIDNFSWMRLNKHQYPNWQEFRDNRLDINVADIQFITASRNRLSSKINFNEVSFTTSNNTAYNYWRVDFQIVLLAGVNPVAVNKVNITEFMSEQQRNITVRWPGNIGSVAKVKVIPELDITKEDIYIQYQGEIEEEN